MTAADTRSPAERIAAAALAVEGVVAMSAGPAGHFRSYLPGGRSVPGVRVDRTRVQVNVVARWGRPLPELGDAVVAAVRPAAAGRSVIVTVDDVVGPDEVSASAAASLVEIEPPAAPRVPSPHRTATPT